MIHGLNPRESFKAGFFDALMGTPKLANEFNAIETHEGSVLSPNCIDKYYEGAAAGQVVRNRVLIEPYIL